MSSLGWSMGTYKNIAHQRNLFVWVWKKKYFEISYAVWLECRILKFSFCLWISLIYFLFFLVYFVCKQFKYVDAICTCMVVVLVVVMVMAVKYNSDISYRTLHFTTCQSVKLYFFFPFFLFSACRSSLIRWRVLDICQAYFQKLLCDETCFFFIYSQFHFFHKYKPEIRIKRKKSSRMMNKSNKNSDVELIRQNRFAITKRW